MSCSKHNSELVRRMEDAQTRLSAYKALGLSLDLTRGKPGKEQLDLVSDMLPLMQTPEECVAANGLDVRNYGVLDGLPEMKQLFADILGVSCSEVIVGGNASLNLMYDALARLMIFGADKESEPYMLQKKPLKFLCPVPGYDRHFGITESFGFEMISIPMDENGPDMKMVEEYVKDSSVKGIWCVPKFSNPDGIVYSDETVRAFARLKPAAKDFRIFWDNAYCVHEIYDKTIPLLNIMEEAKKYHNEDLLYIFASTSKITFPGAGVSVIAASEKNIAYIKSLMTYQTIGHDKINQLRHVKYLKNMEGVEAIMQKHASVLAPKFQYVDKTFSEKLVGTGATWTKPMGGYFVSLYTPEGCAKRVYELALDAGVKLTAPGSAYPYKIDPLDRHLRIAPSYPNDKDLHLAINILCEAVIIASLEKMIEEN